MTVSRGLPFADRCVCRLQVAHQVEIKDTDTFADKVFSGNSAFDPLAALGSDQPAYFDLLAGLWGSYRVIGSKINVGIQDKSAAAASVGGYRLVICPRNASTAFSNWDDMATQPRAKYKLLTPAANQNRLTNQLTTSQMFGLGDVEKTSLQVHAVVTANPATEWFWHVCAQASQVATDTTIDLVVRLEYEVEFFNRIAVGESFAVILAKNADVRADYLKLKAMTPDKSGRVPQKGPLDDLRDFVEGNDFGRPPSLAGGLGQICQGPRDERKAQPRRL